MSKTAVGIVSAIFGAIIGGFAMNRFDKVKTEALLKDKEAEVTSYYMNLMTKEMDPPKDPEPEQPAVDLNAISHDISVTQHYVDDAPFKRNAPRPIPPEEFGDSMQYDQVNLRYWSDDVVTDDKNRVIAPEDVADWIGTGYAAWIGMYESDAIHIRNEDMMTEYEVIAQFKPFSLVRDSVPVEPRGPLDD